jgi:hypothetical protein
VCRVCSGFTWIWGGVIAAVAAGAKAGPIVGPAIGFVLSALSGLKAYSLSKNKNASITSKTLNWDEATGMTPNPMHNNNSPDYETVEGEGEYNIVADQNSIGDHMGDDEYVPVIGHGAFDKTGFEYAVVHGEGDSAPGTVVIGQDQTSYVVTDEGGQEAPLNRDKINKMRKAEGQVSIVVKKEAKRVAELAPEAVKTAMGVVAERMKTNTEEQVTPVSKPGGTEATIVEPPEIMSGH